MTPPPSVTPCLLILLLLFVFTVACLKTYSLVNFAFIITSGIVLYQLLALDRPFEGNSTASLVKSILNDDVPALPAHYGDEIK